MWDCLKCGTMGILGLPICPHCKEPRPNGETETPAAPVPESGTQEDASAGAGPEPQVTQRKGGTNAKGK